MPPDSQVHSVGDSDNFSRSNSFIWCGPPSKRLTCHFDIEDCNVCCLALSSLLLVDLSPRDILIPRCAINVQVSFLSLSKYGCNF